jgi:2-polyprenyl-3-methyl-5-hydroxy-6-metoxy-1,4-benzoquinol methylase
MIVKEHYNNHLGNFYSWMIGDFDQNEKVFKAFCTENNIIPKLTKTAIDLGAGNGIQTTALAKAGFNVTAIDFNNQLLAELQSRCRELSVDVIRDDIRNLQEYSKVKPELIICWGDTIAHLGSQKEAAQLIADASEIIIPGGKIILSFRNYSKELNDAQRFIHVKSDAQRILTCFLEYFPEKIRVTDLFYELEHGKWVQKVSSYFKIRLSKETVVELLNGLGFRMLYEQEGSGLIKIIAEKKE